MKIKWPVLLILAVAVASIFLPAVGLHVHAQLGEEVAALYPETLSLADLMFRGKAALPLAEVPAMGLISFGGGWFLAGLIFLLAGGVLGLISRKGCPQLSLGCGALSVAFLGTGVLQLMNLDSSLLFTILITVQAWAYLPLVAAVVLVIFSAIELKGGVPVLPDDRKLRLLSGVAAVITLALMLLPVYQIALPATLTEDPADSAAASRSVSLLSAALGQEPNLAAVGAEKGVFSNVLSGDLAALEPYSGDGNNIRGVFLIKTQNTGLNASLLAAAILLVLTAILALIPRVDRWFPTAMACLAVVLLGASALEVMTMGTGDMYASASRQLLHLGVGGITPLPLLAVLGAAASALAGVFGIRYANEPYFVNPVPQGFRIRLVAITLAALSLLCLLMPAGTISFTKAGKNKVQATTEISGVRLLTFSAAGDLADPVDSKGKEVYGPEDEEFSAPAVNQATATLARRLGGLNWAAVILTVAALALLLFRPLRKPIIALLLAAFVLRGVQWLVLARTLPRSVATGGGSLWLYAALPLLVFGAFFTNFCHLEEIPKKYKLFLMMLPFLLAVFLFSYLPLYGWSYAFFNYKFGLPMDQQEFVGFKWFTEMFTNPANRENIYRVLKNTFGMSGLNLLTSWMPMVFAIFLNEITRTRFKKFVQIFTTLPNFISWALVFSFAMCMFAADTGIYSKLMISLGLNDPNNPTVWLNSGDHIWLKMWGWSTWKGLGWGAIMYLAAIAGIDQELYEAAEVDGANRWHRMRYITLPGLLPTFFVLFMLSISNILNNGMEQYLVFQNPMNRQTIEVLDLYVYNITIASGGTTLYSYATAIGILKTLVSVTLLFSANFVSKKLRGESIM